MLTEEKAERRAPIQGVDFKKGNEMVALAAKQIDYHIMGYYPITPSTEIAEELDEMYAQGEHTIRMIPADGEHGAAGICYGAATGGGRVLNATSANGLLYAMEQLPVQSGTRFPMVLNVVTRSVSGPLDIRGDHSDIMMALNAGWIILLARDPQAAYDMNIIAVRIGEHPEVRLPVIVAMDGFFTSHQKRRVRYFEDAQVVQDFVGQPQASITALDPSNPVTIGPYMNDPDLINNKYQLKLAMDAAERLLPSIFAEYGALSGRYYPLVDSYLMEDAEAALFLLNSAAETAKDAVDKLRAQGHQVGVVSPNVLRPFPGESIRQALRNTKAVLIADRADSYGAHGGNMSLEVKAALKDDPENRTLCLSRIYGLGGKDFYTEDAEELLREALRTAASGGVEVAFDYFGATLGQLQVELARPQPPMATEELSPGLVATEWDEKQGKVKARIGGPRQLTAMPERIAPGHGACPGCGIFPSLKQFLAGIEGHVVLLFQTGCAMVVTTGYPYSSHRVTYIHNLFQNGAATLSGLVEMYRERIKRGELADEDITFIMVSGDGGMDIGMGPTIGSALRGHPMIVLEYDNQGYMNTGNQLSYATPLGHATSTSHVGPAEVGKSFHHKDTAQIMAATHIPYVFTSVEGLGTDLVRKAAKAQWYTKHGSFVYGKFLSVCPLSWRYDERFGTQVVKAAVDCCFFPIYEVENGITTINYDPEERGKRIPASQWLGTMGKTRHLLKPEYAETLHAFEKEVERRWRRLKAMHEHPLL
ncbi:MAG: pyruvate synthase [Chloroflexi bacterium RBG_13_54_9]|nr:MAG: pyruvate synthase [Chloroflexi bacterium RBG_13_54_9]